MATGHRWRTREDAQPKALKEGVQRRCSSKMLIEGAQPKPLKTFDSYEDAHRCVCDPALSIFGDCAKQRAAVGQVVRVDARPRDPAVAAVAGRRGHRVRRSSPLDEHSLAAR